MPYASQSQRIYMHIHHPEIAKRWDAEGAKQNGLPLHVPKKTAKIPKVVRKYKSKITRYKKHLKT